MGRRYDIDWAAIERDYRLGQLTDSELAKSHKVSRGALLRKAKNEGWTRDLSAEVRTRTRAALIGKASQRVTDSGKESPAQPVASDVDAAVEVSVHVIEKHRRLLDRFGTITDKLLGDLDEALTIPDEIEQAIIEETADDKNSKRRLKMLKAVDLPARAQAINALANTARNVIAAERKAFNLDEPGEGDGAEAVGGTKVVIVPPKDGTGAPIVRKLEPDDLPPT